MAIKTIDELDPVQTGYTVGENDVLPIAIEDNGSYTTMKIKASALGGAEEFIVYLKMPDVTSVSLYKLDEENGTYYYNLSSREFTTTDPGQSGDGHKYSVATVHDMAVAYRAGKNIVPIVKDDGDTRDSGMRGIMTNYYFRTESSYYSSESYVDFVVMALESGLIVNLHGHYAYGSAEDVWEVAPFMLTPMGGE